MDQIQPKFQIGDQVWRATFDSTEDWVTCPDCGGTKTLKATLFDGAEYIIDCANCSHGYEPPRGAIRLYTRSPQAELGRITGIEICADKIEYRVSPHWIVDEARLFTDRDSALACAQKMATEARKEEEKRFLKKEKDTRSWAWHVKYHRGQIKEHERQLEYHRRKLQISRDNAKKTRASSRTEAV